MIVDSQPTSLSSIGFSSIRPHSGSALNSKSKLEFVDVEVNKKLTKKFYVTNK